MSRDMTPDAVTASTSAVVRPVIMVDMDFASGHQRVHTGVGTLVYGGNEFYGIGGLGKISSFEENASPQATSIQLTLSGVDPGNLSIALGEHYQGRTVIVYIALLDADHQLVDDPVVLWRGRMDNMNVTLGSTAIITVTAQNVLADWDRPRVRRYNNDDQQAKYPGDKGLEYVEKSVNQEILWGA